MSGSSARVPTERAGIIVAAAPAGRPRDPEVDERITRAAAQVYGAEGWARFSVDAVARRAGVGKASIYLRWPNKEALLAAALATRLAGVRDIDTGSVRDDLVALAGQVLHAFLDESGGAMLRLMLEAEAFRPGRSTWTGSCSRRRRPPGRSCTAASTGVSSAGTPVSPCC